MVGLAQVLKDKYLKEKIILKSVFSGVAWILVPPGYASVLNSSHGDLESLAKSPKSSAKARHANLEQLTLAKHCYCYGIWGRRSSD